MKAGDILPLAVDWLAGRYPDSLIVPEFSIGTWGAALLDVAAITENEIVGVEIKGDGDSPTRMQLQAALYSKAATRMFFLPAPSLEERCFKHTPPAWGRLVVCDGKVVRRLTRCQEIQGDNDPSELCIAPAQLLQCLWREELDGLARLCGVITGKVGVEKLRWELAEQVPLKRLRTEVCYALRRRNWSGYKTVYLAADRLAA